jgi:hypothetical protein
MVRFFLIVCVCVCVCVWIWIWIWVSTLVVGTTWVRTTVRSFPVTVTRWFFTVGT